MKQQRMRIRFTALIMNLPEKIEKLAGHQILAINRGEKEGFLKAAVTINRDDALSLIERKLIKKIQLQGNLLLILLRMDMTGCLHRLWQMKFAPHLQRKQVMAL